ncbi:MAG TPA: PAS domain-containing protein, partial [Reyranella sp.]|nr:PAS domain-containing protein [Reyranella sp.]
MLQLSSAPVRPSLLLPSLAAIVAIGIFVVDTVTPLDIAVAVLYVAVVLLAMDFAGRNGILIVAGGCAALTVLSYAITHGHDPSSGPFLRCLISLVAIAITGALAARHQGTIDALRAHASLLDLTHDTIFVRNHDDVITYWNRAATELYGWRPEQAIGRKAAELLHTEFPAPFDDVMSELNRTGRWEGELVHTARDGRRLVVA